MAVKVAEVPRAFSTLEAEEGSTGPRRLEVTLVGVQHLPKMDGIMGRCDAYSKMLWRGIEYKTEVVKNSYDAEWNSVFSLDVEECSNGTFPRNFPAISPLLSTTSDDLGSFYLFFPGILQMNVRGPASQIPDPEPLLGRERSDCQATRALFE